MHPSLLFTLLPLFAILAKAQTLSNGHLIIYAPTNVLACEAANIQWTWTGDQDDLLDNTVSIAVEQESDIDRRRRSLAEASPIRLVRKRSQIHSRDIAINIAGGSAIPLSQQQWVWNSVGVPVGTYRMALTIQGQGYTGYSSPFTVSEGDDTSCLGGTGLGVPTTTATAVQTSNAPGEVVSTAAPNPTNQTTQQAAITSTNAPSATSATTKTAPTFQAQSDSGNNGSKGPSGGAVAAAVLIPLLVAGVLLYLFCMRRKKVTVQGNSPNWSEKFTGLLGGGGMRSNKEHRRQISTPMDPVHAAGMAMHEPAVKTQMRQANNDSAAVTQTPEHWVDFHPDVQESDAHLVSPARVDDMVRASMEMSNNRKFYQQGSNEALRQSTSTSAQRSTMMTESDGNSTLPSYLRDADFTSCHTHSSFGHDVNGAPVGRSDSTNTLRRSSTQRSQGLERSESKVRRKPVPTYSTVGVSQAAGQSTSKLSDDSSPFSDSHGVSHESHEDMISSSNTSIHDGSLHEILQAEQEDIGDSPTLGVSPALLHTPASMAGEFPSSVHGSPAPRVLLNTPRGSVTEEDKKEPHQLSINMPAEDRGFRVSF